MRQSTRVSVTVQSYRMDAEETQVSVQFTTQLPAQYRVPQDVLVSTRSARAFSARQFFRGLTPHRPYCRVCQPRLLGWVCPKWSTRYLGLVRPNAAAVTDVALLRTTTLCSTSRIVFANVLACSLRADPAQAFDFLIAGELLRQPLEKFLLAHSVSTVSSHMTQAE